MNPKPTVPAPLPPEVDATEWAMQERARAQVRDGVDVECADASPEAASYHRIAQALRREPAGLLPSNFAYQLAQQASRQALPARLDMRVEQWLVRVLVAVMALGGGAAAVVYGSNWLRSVDRAASDAGGWVLVLAACMLMTWGLQGWRAWRLRAASQPA